MQRVRSHLHFRFGVSSSAVVKHTLLPSLYRQASQSDSLVGLMSGRSESANYHFADVRRILRVDSKALPQIKDYRKRVAMLYNVRK